jgi:hypothetical protein
VDEGGEVIGPKAVTGKPRGRDVKVGSSHSQLYTFILGVMVN